MAKLFFSYSADDKDFARKLAHDLDGFGHETWIDEEQILWGDSFIEKTQEALRSASAVIVVLSEASRSSQWLAFELGAATAQGKRIFPVVLSDDTSLVPFQLGNLQYLRAQRSEPSEVAAKISRALQNDA